MRALILVAGAALAVSACSGGGQSEGNEVDTLAVNNLIVDENTAAGMNMGGEMNMDMNATGDAATQNMMMNDMTTNDPDTNLANGM